MTAVRKKADDIAEAISTGSCHIVLETSPPDYVQTIARYLESSVQQTRRDGPTEKESDSGDSMFITQKPVPEPVRTRKRRRKTPASPKDLEESEDDYLVSAPPQKATTSHKKTKIKKRTLPKYSFPFLKEKQQMRRRTFFTDQQNRSLHNATMGGFFKCVRELWQGYQGVTMDVSLPTVDTDEDFISPLSEEEEERSEEEDIKVVKMSFLAASKAKCPQPWYTPGKIEDHVKQQSGRRRPSSTSQDVSQDRKMTNKRSTSRSVTTATLLHSDTDGHPCRDLPQKEMGDKHEIHHTSILGRTETPKTKRRLTGGKKKILFQKNELEEELCSDSDATVCDPLQLQRSSSEHTQGGKEAVTTVTQANTNVFQMEELSQTGQEDEEPESQSLLQGLPQFVGDTKNVSVCAEFKLKKKKKAEGDHGSIEEGRGQSQEERDGLHAAASVNVGAEETFSLPNQNGPKPPVMQTCDQLKNCMKNSAHDDNIVRQEKRDFPNSTSEKRKRKKSKFIAENIRQEVGENIESGVSLEVSEASVMCNIEKANDEKEIIMKKGVSDFEGVEQLQSTETAATVNDEQRKKKKEKSITNKCEEDGLENTLETLGSTYKKKKRKNKSMKQSSSLDDTCVEDDAKVSLSSEGVTVEEHVEKKKKKESIFHRVYISYTPDKNDQVEYTDSKVQDEQLSKKKKRREKIDELSNRQASEDTVAQNDEAVSVPKKGKRRTSSFLQADSGEKGVELHQQQSFSSKTVAPGVCDFETESAEIAGEAGDEVSKKKKKKKKKRKTLATQDNGTVSEEPNKMCGSVLTETGIKRKKRSESESVASIDRLDGAADRGRSQAEEDTMIIKKKKKNKKKCKEVKM